MYLCTDSSQGRSPGSHLQQELCRAWQHAGNLDGVREARGHHKCHGGCTGR